MSFIKVKDPRKREELIRDFIETRKRIKDNFIAKKVGEAEYQTGLTKLFKPVTETQKATAKEITEAQKAAAEKFTQELLPIKEGIEELPTKLFRKVFPSIELKASDIMNLGPLAVNALLQAFPKKNIDLAFGLYVQEKQFKIGNKEVNIEDNDINVDDIIFEGTPGFWELITSKNPENYTGEDLDKYRQLLLLTNAVYRDNNPDNNNPKSSKSPKWKNIIKPIWEQIKKQKEEEKEEEEYEEEEYEEPATIPFTSTKGTGLKRPKILPSDPNALIDRFDLLFSSQKAGHTGVRNEIVSILDELKRQGVLKTNEYKKLNSLIKK